jgi:hypothetical protein
MVVFLPMVDIRASPRRLAWRWELHIGSKAGGLAAASAVSLHKFPKKSIYGKLVRTDRIRPI